MHGNLRQMLAGALRSEGLPVATAWPAADGRARVHVDARGRVTAENGPDGEEAGRIEDCSLVTLAHLLEDPRRGPRAAEIRRQIEEAT